MGVGAMSGADFLAGAGDVAFTEYATLARGVDIQPDDRLRGMRTFWKRSPSKGPSTSRFTRTVRYSKSGLSLCG